MSCLPVRWVHALLITITHSQPDTRPAPTSHQGVPQGPPQPRSSNASGTSTGVDLIRVTSYGLEDLRYSASTPLNANPVTRQRFLKPQAKAELYLWRIVTEGYSDTQLKLTATLLWTAEPSPNGCFGVYHTDGQTLAQASNGLVDLLRYSERSFSQAATLLLRNDVSGTLHNPGYEIDPDFRHRPLVIL